ncbi:MAG: family 65 glycosyl hydrolase [Candidatus Izimaplasma sp.]|nr:family 65 glycosyl hydrolase [Candidatus Izimaplasma bacterium]
MPKIKNQYLEINPWKIEEIGYKKSESQVSESLFSLANEYMGIRGYFEEDHSEDSLQGVYFNGIYAYSPKQIDTSYLGITDKVHFMVNAVNWVKTNIIINNQNINFSKIQHKNFKRTLDFKTGEMKRSYTALLDQNLEVEFQFNRLLLMEYPQYGYQNISIKSNKKCNIKLSLSLDFSTLHWQKYRFWESKDKGLITDKSYILSELPTKQRILAMMNLNINQTVKSSYFEQDLSIGQSLTFDLDSNKEITITRKFTAIKEKNINVNSQTIIKKATIANDKQPSYEEAIKLNKSYYKNYWDQFDIVISGNEEHQQGIRYCLFQLQQTYHGYDEKNNIGAKGLTGEAYSGHTFWDTETFCFPFYLLNTPDAAKNLLLFRYHTLDEAKLRAKELDCKGACYPIATLNGEESCDLWQHASLQPQPSTAVVYAIKHYLSLTKDYQFLIDFGMEMLIEISRYLFSRGDFNPSRTHFGFFGVMGPDEFQMMVHHNTYTNYLGKETFKYTLKMLEYLKTNYSKSYNELIKKNNVKEQEILYWQEAKEKMHLLYDKETKRYEQHLGYYELPHIDISKIPETDFPLYHNWTYDRIYRNDMIKQPDVLMMMFLFNSHFDENTLKENYDFYESRCIHESSLSPSIHSILALQLGLKNEGYQFFEFATRLDLDNYNRNTKEGLHLTSIYAAWMNIVYGYGGLRTDQLPIKLNPTIPDTWNHYSFNFTYQTAIIKVNVYREYFTLSLEKDLEDAIIIQEQKVVLKKGKHIFKAQKKEA